MANTNFKYGGLQPLYMEEAHRTAMLFPLTNNYTTDVFIGDPALAVTAGRVERASTTGSMLGVVLGIYKQQTPKSLRAERLTPVQYFAATPGATNEWFVLVTMNPNTFYICQEDGITSSLTEANNWGAVDVTYGAGGNTTTGMSGCLLDSNTISNTATLMFQLIWPAVNHYDIGAGAYIAVSAAGAALNYAKWIVKPFNCQLTGGVVGVAFA
jgi:hypothetical protein